MRLCKGVRKMLKATREIDRVNRKWRHEHEHQHGNQCGRPCRGGDALEHLYGKYATSSA